MKGKINSLEKIREIILAHQNIVLCGHTNPDGDAIGASLSLASSLQKMGKNIMVLLEPYEYKYDVIPNKNLIVEKESIGDIDLFISLDCGDMGRLEGIEDIFHRAKQTMNIDHHVSNTFFAEYNHVEVDASSTSEIVFKLLNGHCLIDSEIASGLYAGLIYDTGGFRHTSTSPTTMQIAGELMAYDIPYTKIYNTLFDRRTFSEMKITGRAFDRAESHFDNKVIFSLITTKDLDDCNASNKDLDAVINFLKGVDETKVACFLYQKNETDIKVSLRGNSGYDVCALAQKFGGGGHVKAAGCTIKAPIEKAKEMILEEIGKML